jgi:hypothetical protein
VQQQAVHIVVSQQQAASPQQVTHPVLQQGVRGGMNCARCTCGACAFTGLAIAWRHFASRVSVHLLLPLPSAAA